jgi:hypothetical protein
MPQNSSKLKFCLNVFVNIFKFIHVLKVRERYDYNVNEYETFLKTTLCILMIFLCCNEPTNGRKLQ